VTGASCVDDGADITDIGEDVVGDWSKLLFDDGADITDIGEDFVGDGSKLLFDDGADITDIGEDFVRDWTPTARAFLQEVLDDPTNHLGGW